MAPGKCILSTINTLTDGVFVPGYASMSGTSMSTPTVVGAVALYKESRPNATPAEVRDALRYPRQPELERRDRSRTRPTSRCSTCHGSGRSGRSR